MISSHFSRIYVLESLPDGQLLNGRRLREDIEVCAVFHQRNLPVDLIPVKSLESFRECLGRIHADVQNRSEYPLLHIECHGNSSGIELADGGFMSWSQLEPFLTAINVATKCNLFVALAACYGAHLTEIVAPTSRAPVWGLLSPTEQATSHDLFGSFVAFYSELLNSLSGDKALAAFKSAPPRKANYCFVNAEEFFRKAYANYVSVHTTERELWKRATSLRYQVKKSGTQPLSTSEIVHLLRNGGLPHFEEHRRKFFMADLYPENASRFRVNWDDINREAAGIRTKGISKI